MPDCNFTKKCYFTCDQGRIYSATNLIVLVLILSGHHIIYNHSYDLLNFVAKSNMGKYSQTLFDDQLLFTALLY